MSENNAREDGEEVKELPLAEAAQCLLEECRMILPGIQAILGFQLIAIFNNGFDQKLTPSQQQLHGVAIFLMTLAVVFIMTPAAYHRQTRIREVSDRFLTTASRFLLWSMPLLAAGILIDVYLIAQIIYGATFGLIFTLVLSFFFILFWFVLPRSGAFKRLIRQ